MMKNYYSIRRIALILFAGNVLSWMLPSPASAQFAPGENKNPVEIPTPQVWGFNRYGDMQPNLNTGTISLGIPIYTYRDNDFELPISLGYGSNGLLPNMQTGALGLGWHLNAGGTITRDINGRPDEGRVNQQYKGFYAVHSNPTKFPQMPPRDTIYKYSYVPNPFGSGDSDEDKIMSFHQLDGIYYDLRPDIFHFNFMGYSGSFILDYNQKIHVFNTSSSHGEFKIDIPEFTAYVRNITIVTKDGYRYLFAPEVVKEGWEVHSWLLTEIKAPNGRTISFAYEELDIQSFSPHYKSESWSAVDDYRSATGWSEGGAIQESTRSYPYLKKITIDEKLEIIFNYGTKEREKRRDNFPVYATQRLNSIHVIEKVSGLPENLKTATLTYYDSYSTSNPKLLLHKVNVSGEGDYIMDYYKPENFPYLDTYAVDHWGFYNGLATRETFIPELRFYEFNYSEDIVGTSRNPVFEESLRGMLKQITYPTKGRSEFIYESNDYSARVYKEKMHSFNPYVQEYGLKEPAGGVRIFKIINYDNQGESSTREFTYERLINGMMFSSGILLNTPRYEIQYRVVASSDNMMHPHVYRVRVAMSNIPVMYTMDKTHVAYSRVREKRDDGSYIDHVYSDYRTIPDALPDMVYPRAFPWEYTDPGDDINYLLTPFCTMHSQRGKLIEQTTFNAQGDTVLRKSYIYNKDINLKYVPGYYHVELIRRPYFYRHYYEDYPLERVVQEEYRGGQKITTTSQFTYNALGQTTEEKTTDSQGYTRRTKTQYLHELAPSTGVEKRMLDANFSGYPIRTLTSLQRSLQDPEQLTGGIKYSYTDTLGSSTTPAGKGFKLYKTEQVGLLEPEGFSGYNIDSYLTPSEITYDKYDIQGRILQTTDAVGVQTTYIWGYGGLYPVAQIVNASLSTIKSIPGLSNIENRPLDGAIENQETALYNLTGALVTLYTYKPFVGILSVKDPSGRMIRYKYDEHNRLEAIRDQDDNLIEAYRYNYKQ